MSYNSDVWSLGITVLELSTGHFPYTGADDAAAPPRRLAFWDLLHYIVENDPPVPPAGCSAALRDFANACLRKSPDERVSSSDLLGHAFCAAAMQPAEVSLWIRGSLARVPAKG